MLSEDISKKLVSFSEKEKDLLNRKYLNNVFEKHFNKELFKDKYISIKRHTRFAKVPEHFHNFIELTYVYKGTINQKINGKDVSLKEGEVLLLNQYTGHEIAMTSKDDIIINFSIESQFFDNISSIFDENNIINKFILTTIYGGTKQGKYLLFRVSEIESIQKILEDIIKEMYKAHTLKNIRIQFLIGMLMTELLIHLDNSNFDSNMTYDNKIVSKVLDYIDSNYNDASLKEISLILNQPNYKISKLIKESTGKNFREILIEKRIEKVKELLKNTNHPISEVIKTIGYENISHFYKLFKKKHNVSLKEFRNS